MEFDKRIQKRQYTILLMSKIKVIIPAYNEEKAIAHVIMEIPNTVDEINPASYFRV